MSRDAGFTLLEALIAIVLTLVVAASAVVLTTANVPMMVAAPEGIDLAQRGRAVLQLLARDLSMAGAGPTDGPRVGPLALYFAPILPRLPHLDAPATARADALTIMAVPMTRAQSASALPLPGGATTAVLAPQAHCGIGLVACGFTAETSAVMFDSVGNVEVAAVTAVDPMTLTLRPRLGAAGPALMTGASIVEAQLHAYYWDAAASQLRHHDLDRTDMPVADDVTGFVVEYFGDVSPPREPRPPLGEANCLYDAAGVPTAALVLLGPPPFTLRRLPLERFTDGPWCGASAMQFDADLLRVRAVRITLRLRAGPSGRGRRVPDLEFTTELAPRNLAVRR